MVASAAIALAAGAAPPALRVLDLDGRRVEPLSAGATVLVFSRTDCPIGNRYAPELRRLQERFAARGLRFWRVYPDRAETPDAIRRHGREFAFGFEALRDPHHDLVRLTGATVTPEVAVFVPGPQGPLMVYRGRIDDRVVDFGRTRPAPLQHDLERVLEAFAAGKTLVPATTPAIGCFIPGLG